METLTALLGQGGLPAYAAAGLGACACLSAFALMVGALFGARSNILRGVAFFCVGFAFAGCVAGVAGSMLGRQKTEQSIAKTRPATAERQRRAGWVESRASLSVALPLAAPATVLALGGFIIAARRRWGEQHERPPAGPGLFILLLLFTGATWLFGARLWKQPVPGRDLDDASWKVLDLTDALDANEWDKCFTTPWSLGTATPAHALAAHADNQRRCAEHFTAPADLNRLLGAAWLDDATVRESISKRMSADPTPAPTPVVADKTPEPVAPSNEVSTPATPDPALAMLESKLRHCFKKHPKLDLHVTISKEGRVDLPKRSAKCLKLAVAKIKLPAGNARTLEVQLK